MLAPNIIIPFDGLHANIPSGFTRDTSFDGLYIKIATSDWGNTGGSATHTHTSPTHTHTYANDTHTHTSGIIDGNVSNAGGAQHQDSPLYDIAKQDHTHSSATSGAMENASITSDVTTIGSANNEFSKYDLIFIKSTGYNSFPVDSIAIRLDTVDRDNATHFDSLDGRYMKGAGTSANAGNATTVTSHIHTTTHSHTLGHGQIAITSSGVITGALGSDDSAGSVVRNHTHLVSFETYEQTATNNDNTPSESIDLKHQELHFWKFTSSTVPIVNDIAIFTGATIPTGWVDLGYDDVYVKGKASGETLTTGGSNTHGHDPISHSHAGETHAHNWTTSIASQNGKWKIGGEPAAATHSHIGTTSSSTSPTTGTTDVVIDATNHEPEYINVRLIKATSQSLGGGAAVINQIIN